MSSSRSDHTRQLLARLARAYQVSKQRPATCSLSLARMLDDASAYAKARLTINEQALANKCYQACRRSRILAAGGNASATVGEACQAIAAARTVAKSAMLSDEARLLCLAEVHPAEAFVEHQYENPHSARGFVEKSLAADQELEDHFGHHYKIAHRLYSVTMSASILFQQSQPLEAATRLALLLRLLAGECEALSEPGNWSQARIDRLPEGMRDFHAMQAIEVLYSFVSTLDFGVRQQTVEAFLRTLGTNYGGRRAASITQDSVTLLEKSLGRGFIQEMECLSYSAEVVETMVGQTLMLAVTLDTVCQLLEIGYESPEANCLMEEIRFDLPQLGISQVVVKRQRLRMMRLSAQRVRGNPVGQRESSSLAIGA